LNLFTSANYPHSLLEVGGACRSHAGLKACNPFTGTLNMVSEVNDVTPSQYKPFTETFFFYISTFSYCLFSSSSGPETSTSQPSPVWVVTVMEHERVPLQPDVGDGRTWRCKTLKDGGEDK